MVVAKSATSSPSNPFIKQLASSNRTTRDHALSTLRTYLSSPRPTPLTNIDLLKLWKGLFYCMYMCDKPRNQQNLARDLAALTGCLVGWTAKIMWLTAFWTTMSKEWAGIESLRMNKYLYLIRCYVNKGFEVLAQESWSQDVLAAYSQALRADGGPLSPRDAKVPGGLKLHVLDVWIDELEKVDEAKAAPVDIIMESVRKLSKDSLVKSVRARAAETIEDARLDDGKAWREEGGEGNDSDTGEHGDFGGFDD